MGDTWNAAWEARPADGDQASDIDLFFNEFKTEVRSRASVENIYGVGSDDNGLNRLGSARAFIQNTAPTDIVGPGQWNGAAEVFAGTLLSTDELGASTADLGAGRFWVDLDGLDGASTASDDNQLNVWNEASNTFVPVTAQGADAAGIGASNLIYNGSFEITDGTGSIASTAVANRWADPNTATFAYDSVNDSTEGDGVAFEVIANGGVNEAATQTLAGLKESTTYVVRARVRPVVGTCDLQVTGGAATVTDTSGAATGVFETVEVQPVTTAGPADLVVRLESNLAADECDWDHVAVYERNAVVPPPGIQAIFTQDIVNDATIDTTFGNNPFLTTTVRVPSAGYIVQLDATMSLFVPNEMMLARLVRDDCAGGAFTAISPVLVAGGTYGAAADMRTNVTLNAVDVSPVPGGACIYRVEVRENGAVAGEVNPLVAIQTGSSLRALILPVR